MNSPRFTADTIRDYLDRQLGPNEERVFEEAMLEDAELLAEVRAEMAMRRGAAVIARPVREQAPVASAANDAPAETAAAPSTVVPLRARSTEPANIAARRPWLGYAAAAAVAMFAIVPTVMLMMNRADQAELVARVQARLDQEGRQASYALPAAYVQDVSVPGTTQPEPIHIRLPKDIPNIVLELPDGGSSLERRMVLRNEDGSGAPVELHGVRAVGSDALGFEVASGVLRPGRYAAEIGHLEDGKWVPDRRFMISIERPN